MQQHRGPAVSEKAGASCMQQQSNYVNHTELHRNTSKRYGFDDSSKSLLQIFVWSCKPIESKILNSVWSLPLWHPEPEMRTMVQATLFCWLIYTQGRHVTDSSTDSNLRLLTRAAIHAGLPKRAIIFAVWQKVACSELSWEVLQGHKWWKPLYESSRILWLWWQFFPIFFGSKHPIQKNVTKWCKVSFSLL